MMDWTTYYYSVIDSTTLLIAVLGISVVLVLRDLENRWRWFCVVFFSDMVLKTSASLISRFSALYWHNIPLQTACDFLAALFSSTIIPLLTLYLLRCCSQEPHKSFLWKLILSLWGVSAATAVGDLLQRTLLPDGTEQKRWLILVYLLFTAIGLIVCLIKTTFKTPIHSHIGLFAGACFNYAARYGIDAVYRSGKAVSKAKGRAGESKGKSCRAANAAALHL